MNLSNINDRKVKRTQDSALSKFFDKGNNTQLAIPSTISNKNKQHYKLSKLCLERMICSEDVSRKKKTDTPTKSNKTRFPTNHNDENKFDFLENLKRNFHREHMKLSPTESFNQKKPRSKPKVLFNEESLKLMQNFKEYIKEKDQYSEENKNIEFPILNENSVPFKDTSNSQIHQSNIFQNNLGTIYSNELLNFLKPNPPLLGVYQSSIEERSLSQISVSNPLNFGGSIEDSVNENDSIIHYPTPPFINNTNF